MTGGSDNERAMGDQKLPWVLGAFACVATATLLVACKQGPTGTFDSSGFVRRDVGLFVPYANPATQSLVEGDWGIDNYYVARGGAVKEKTGKGWEAFREFDWNNDGTIDRSERKEEPIYDLRFRHARDNGVIWVKVHPVHPSHAQKKLTVALNNYADSLAGTALFAQASLFLLESSVERQHTTFLVDQGPLLIDGHDGYAGTIELAEVSKLQQDPEHRDSKVRIVFSKFARLEKLDHGAVSVGFNLELEGGSRNFTKYTSPMVEDEPAKECIKGIYEALEQTEAFTKEGVEAGQIECDASYSKY